MACGRPASAASIWPVWLQSSSMACLPRITRPGCSLSTSALSSLATASGCSSSAHSTRMARSAPMAMAVRSVSWHCVTPQETAMISVTTPFSFSRTASSTAISSKGFMLILTLAMSTPAAVALDAHLDVVVDHPLDGDQDLHERCSSVRIDVCVGRTILGAGAGRIDGRGTKIERPYYFSRHPGRRRCRGPRRRAAGPRAPRGRTSPWTGSRCGGCRP